VSDGPDPLGKRALFWMPVDPLEVTDAVPGPTSGRASRAEPTTTGSFLHQVEPAGKHALYSESTRHSEPTPDSEDRPDSPSMAAGETESATDPDTVPDWGLFTVCCSSCASMSRVGVVEFLALQFPFGAWLPRGRFDRWMTCPACRRRTWTSVTLSR
jgi:hypothetical protein